MNEIIKHESAVTMFGVSGRAFNVVADTSTGRIINQTAIFSRRINTHESIHIKLKFDDEYGNGHESFSITGEIRDSRIRRDNGIVMCGCIHDEIIAHFPEFSHIVKWHLCSIDGPMHYIGNTCYLAGDKDCNGRAKGDVASFDVGVRFGNSPVTQRLNRRFFDYLQRAIDFNKTVHKTNPNYQSFEIIEVMHEDNEKTGAFKFSPKYTFSGFPCKWYQCPFDDKQAAEEFANALNNLPIEFCRIPTSFSEGKARELDSARHAAIWLDATDEELSAPRAALEEKLKARLPALLEAFKADMLACGFIWPEDK